MIATCTTLIGLLPTYETIFGIAAPIILTMARLLQGISVGGEYGGALAFIAESAPSSRRSFYTGWQTFTIGLALLVGAAVASLMTATMAPDALQSWGWRIPFLAGLPLGFVGLYMRLRLEETPHFKAVREQLVTEKAPLWSSVRKEWRALLLGMGMIATPEPLHLHLLHLLSDVPAVGARLLRGTGTERESGESDLLLRTAAVLCASG